MILSSRKCFLKFPLLLPCVLHHDSFRYSGGSVYMGRKRFDYSKIANIDSWRSFMNFYPIDLGGLASHWLSNAVGDACWKPYVGEKIYFSLHPLVPWCELSWISVSNTDNLLLIPSPIIALHFSFPCSELSTIFYRYMIVELQRKIQHCERSELRSHLEWTKT